eukprot:TRINITY_DN18410_c0_g1_i1.p1 TRINITY_DN18410_c0_g1~~TRINITY_DN18410_c0_g1_i1.p1  ORF type:complete len:846 (-),score=90.72 TRINITY_DN18410_c0_g1_i1:100-2637(-)
MIRCTANMTLFSVDARPTGTGKTTYRPAALARRGFRVVVAVPAIIHAIRAAEYVRTKLKVNARYVNDEQVWNCRPQILYMTTNYLFNRIHYSLCDGRNPFEGFDYVILDEAHKSDEAYVGSQILINESHVPLSQHISLASATLSDRSLALFSNLQRVETEPLESADRTEIPPQFHERLSIRTNLSDLDDALDAAVDVLEREIGLWQEHNCQPGYGSLVILPGISDQKRLLRLVERHLDHENVQITLLHSSMPGHPSFDKRAYNLIVGNSVAAESVTLPVNVVIISGIQKREESSTRQERMLTPYIIDQREFRQSAGRVGRRGQHHGKVYCLFNEQDYRHLEPESPMGTEIGDIVRLVSTLIIHGLDMSPYLSYFGGEERLCDVMRYMFGKGALSTESRITEFGLFARSMPFTLCMSKMLYDFSQGITTPGRIVDRILAVTRPIVVEGRYSRAASALIVAVFTQGYEHMFQMPAPPSWVSYNERERWGVQHLQSSLVSVTGHACDDDASCIIEIYRRTKDLPHDDLRTFCQQHHLNARYVQQCLEQCRALLNRLRWLDDPVHLTFNFVEDAVAVRSVDNHKVYRTKDGREWIYMSPLDNGSRPFAIYPLKHETVVTTRGTKVHVISAHAIVFNSLTEAAVELVDTLKLIAGIPLSSDIDQAIKDANEYFDELFGHKEHMVIRLDSSIAKAAMLPGEKNRLIKELGTDPFRGETCPRCRNERYGVICILACDPTAPDAMRGKHNVCLRCLAALKTESGLMVPCPVCERQAALLFKMRVPEPKTIKIDPKDNVRILYDVDPTIAALIAEQQRKRDESAAKLKPDAERLKREKVAKAERHKFQSGTKKR